MVQHMRSSSERPLGRSLHIWHLHLQSAANHERTTHLKAAHVLVLEHAYKLAIDDNFVHPFLSPWPIVVDHRLILLRPSIFAIHAAEGNLPHE